MARSAPIPYPGTDPRRRFGRLIDAIAIFLLAVPLFGTLFPTESYFAIVTPVGNDIQITQTVNLPVTPVVLLLSSLATIAYYLAIKVQRPVSHSYLAYIFIFAAFLTALWSPEPGYSFNRALRLAPSIALGVLLPQYYGTRRLVKLMVIAFLISAVISIVMAVLVPSYGVGGLGNGYEHAWRGALINKNSAGFLYALGLIVSIYAWAARAAWRPLCAVTILLCLVILLKAESATSGVGAIAALGIGLATVPLGRVGRPVALLVAVSGGLALFTMMAVVLAAPDVIVSSFGRDLTLTGRTDIWAAVLGLFPQSPVLGFYYGFWGIESAQIKQIFAAIGYHAAYSHNSWIDLWLQTGLLGLFAVAALTIKSLADAARAAFGGRDAFASFYFVILVFIAIRSMTEVQFVDPGIGGVFWLVLAAVSARRSRVLRGRRPATVLAR